MGMNSLEKFFHILYNYELAKQENRRKGRLTPVKSPKLTMSFDFPDVDPPIANAPHEIIYSEDEEQTNLDDNSNNNEIHNLPHSCSCSSPPNSSFASSDEVTTEDDKMTDTSSIDGETTSESDSDNSGTCHHPKHRIYKKRGLTTNSFVKITRKLALIVGIDNDLTICRGCVKQTHRDSEVYNNIIGFFYL